MAHALITGASAGLGRALARHLAARGWRLTLDARGAKALEVTAAGLRALPGSRIAAVAGDVADAGHRAELVAVAAEQGPIDLLVNNASDLGGSPLPPLAALDEAAYERALRVNVIAPQQLTRVLLPLLAPGAVVLNISSDAAVEHYPAWGGYGSSKAALDHQTATWAVEHPELTWYALDPGDLRTAMHQAAFPGEDISDRPLPETVVPAVLALVTSGLPSGRYRAAEIAATLGASVR